MVLGVLTTIGVAWGAALLPGPPQNVASSAPRDETFGPERLRTWSERCRAQQFFFVVTETEGKYHPVVTAPRYEPVWRITDCSEVAHRLREVFQYDMWPWWLPQTTIDAPGVIGVGGHACGWPVYSLRARAVANDIGPADWSWCIRVRPAEGALRRDPSDGVLPLQPIPLGFAVDTGLFAAVWWLVLLGPRDVRRSWRLRSCRCPQCGYSRHGLDSGVVCPECGVGTVA
jgi:hypothetical protein